MSYLSWDPSRLVLITGCLHVYVGDGLTAGSHRGTCIAKGSVKDILAVLVRLLLVILYALFYFPSPFSFFLFIYPFVLCPVRSVASRVYQFARNIFTIVFFIVCFAAGILLAGRRVWRKGSRGSLCKEGNSRNSHFDCGQRRICLSAWMLSSSRARMSRMDRRSVARLRSDGQGRVGVSGPFCSNHDHHLRWGC